MQFINSTEIGKRSFRGFLQFAVENDNVHWNQYFRFADPCNIHYDYILRTETLQNDLKYFLSTVYGRDSYVKYGNAHLNSYNGSIAFKDTISNTPSTVLPIPKSSVQKPVIEMKDLHVFSTIEASLMDRVLQKFKYEMLYFGYHYDHKLLSSGCVFNDSVYEPCC